MSLEAHIIYRPCDDTYDVWLVDRNQHGSSVYFTFDDGGHLKSQEKVDGRYSPSTVLGGDVLRALAVALKDRGFTPKDEDDTPAIKAHLADAIAVRDSLLAIVSNLPKPAAQVHTPEHS